MAAGVPAAFTQKVPTEISVDTSGGFARIVYRFDGDVDANVRMSNGILVISFNVPVEVLTDRLNPAAAGYVRAAAAIRAARACVSRLRARSPCIPCGQMIACS
jgi:hypothetical protein